ncbi:MAG TPA: hypothetical protein VK588_09435 [Chitinophagaceae bacterium]|nr:hypothetical protein [Chitinophagaceae bacterium]
MKVILAITLTSTLISNCNSNHSTIIAKEYLQNADSIVQKDREKQLFFKEDGNRYLANIKYYSSNELLSIRGSLLDRNYGCNFSFFSKGGLSDFKYNLGDNERNSYNIKFKNGSYSEEGIPLVDFWRSECDTMNCADILFSYFPRRNVNAQYSTDGINYYSLKIEKSNLLPFVMKGRLMTSKKLQSIFFIIDVSNSIINLPGIAPSRRCYDTLVIR